MEIVWEDGGKLLQAVTGGNVFYFFLGSLE